MNEENEILRNAIIQVAIETGVLDDVRKDIPASLTNHQLTLLCQDLSKTIQHLRLHLSEAEKSIRYWKQAHDFRGLLLGQREKRIRELEYEKSSVVEEIKCYVCGILNKFATLWCCDVEQKWSCKEHFNFSCLENHPEDCVTIVCESNS